MHNMFQDFRYAIRQLGKSPVFTAAAVLTLALGMGANTAIFTVMNTILLRSLPVRDPQQLVYLRPTGMPDGAMNTGDSTWSISEDPIPTAWYPFTQTKGVAAMQIELHTLGRSFAILPSVRRAIAAVDRNLPLEKPMTQDAVFEDSYSAQSLFARLATFFGGLAAMLIAIGLYGTLSYRINRRTIEIGVRMALGARRQSVLWMILRESFWMAAAGIAVGLPLAFLCARFLRSMLFGASPYDPAAFAGALITAVLVAFAALIPARKAASLDPMRALRTE